MRVSRGKLGIRREAAWGWTLGNAGVAGLLAGLGKLLDLIEVEDQGTVGELAAPKRRLSTAVGRPAHLSHPAHRAAEDLGRLPAGAERSLWFS